MTPNPSANHASLSELLLVFTNTLPSTSNTTTTLGRADTASIHVYDSRSAALLGTFKNSQSQRNACAIVPRPYGSGSTRGLLTAQSDKAFLHWHLWQKESMEQKLLCAERVSALAVSHDGLWCAAGTTSGRLFFWDLLSGDLLRIADVHFKKVSVVRFSRDDQLVLTGSEDASVHAYFTADLADVSAVGNSSSSRTSATTNVQPWYSLTGHTLAITDIQCGFGQAGTCRVLTSSLDRTVKMWDLRDGSCVSTMLFPSLVHCAVWNTTETALFAGCQDGHIYRVDFFSRDPQTQPQMQVSTIAEMHHVDPSSTQRIYPSPCGKPVLTLERSLDGTLLYAGAGEQVHIWDVYTRQVMQTITVKGAVVQLLTTLQPANLFLSGHGAFMLSADLKLCLSKTLSSSHEDSISSMYGDTRTRSAITLELGDHRRAPPPIPSLGHKQEATSAARPLEEMDTEKKDRIAQLEAECARLKAINQELYQLAVQEVVSAAQQSRS